MGQAKRRKQLDPNYGKGNFVIRTSPFTGKYLVCFPHKEGEKVISPHRKRKDAENAVKMCELCLASFTKEETSAPLDQWFKCFLGRLNDEFDYEDDDEIFAVAHVVNGVLVIDGRRETTNKVTAEINIEHIKKYGSRLYTYSPYE